MSQTIKALGLSFNQAPLRNDNALFRAQLTSATANGAPMRIVSTRGYAANSGVLKDPFDFRNRPPLNENPNPPPPSPLKDPFKR